MSEFSTVLADVIKNNSYIVAQGTNGMTYTGRVIGYDDTERSLVVIYEKQESGKRTEFKTDLYVDNLCSLQETTKEDIERVRDNKRTARTSRDAR